jgi:hypothetical protein
LVEIIIIIKKNPKNELLHTFIFRVFLIIIIEVFSYLWHRYGAHTDILSGPRISHQIHHNYDLDYEHKAHSDFIWILFLLILVEIFIVIFITYYSFFNNTIILSFIFSLTVFSWNWYIHSAYHDSKHFLNKFEWFRKEKDRHFIHHYNPKVNFGIASHFSDKFLNTWIESM